VELQIDMAVAIARQLADMRRNPEAFSVGTEATRKPPAKRRRAA
jgi:hypothetical protein